MTEPFKSQLDLLARQMAEQMQPFADMQQRIAEAMVPTLTALDCLAEQLEPVRKHFDQIAASMAPVAKAIARTTRLAELVQSVGLLPHASMPVDVLESDVTLDQLPQRGAQLVTACPHAHGVTFVSIATHAPHCPGVSLVQLPHPITQLIFLIRSVLLLQIPNPIDRASSAHRHHRDAPLCVLPHAVGQEQENHKGSAARPAISI